MDPMQTIDVVISAPLSLDTKPRDEGDGNSEKHRGGAIGRLIDLLKSVHLGSDITSLQVPVQLNMPKSQLQVYGESVYCTAQDLLSECADCLSPLQRFLRVVAWHISTTRPAPFAQVPFNPILGETHHVSCGDLNLLLEQVSHHPPVSALYATNNTKNLRLQWWHNACPRFYGNSVEATIRGRRTLWLDSHGETYEGTCPKLLIRFFPVLAVEWVGTMKVQCSETGLEATVIFKSKPFFGLRGSPGEIAGTIQDTNSNELLYELDGFWNKEVTMREVKTGKTSVLFDAEAVLTNLEAPMVRDLSKLEATESVVVWRTAMQKMMRGDWEAAREGKRSVEESQRASAKQRQHAGERWIPKHFELVEEEAGWGWRWRHEGQSVESAPIRLPG